MRLLVLFLTIIAVAACAKDTPPPPLQSSEETRRTVEGGEIIGFVTDRGSHAWRGLPFATAPVGDLRWRAPRPTIPWEGVRQALTFKPRCVQIANAYSPDIEAGSLMGDEDCLYLNVYAPDMNANETGGNSLPVMVWIHGGGNVWGGADQYDPSGLVANENVIVVTVQYRMGPLGWFAHPALREEADANEEPLDSTANFGTLDLIAALGWVQTNIKAFGGNPDNVTIFGESAGGHNVVTLLASPLAKDLFHRAIIQSGSFDSISIAAAEDGSLAPNGSAQISEKLGVQTTADLRAVSPRALYDAYLGDDETGYIDLPLVIEDGVVLPDSSMREAFSSTETFNAVPIMTGTNRDEMKLFQLLNPELVDRYFGVLIRAKNQAVYDAASDYQSRLWRVRAVDNPAKRMAAAGHEDVYAYRFDWDDAGRFLITDFAKLFGAAHSLEIPFVLNKFDFFGQLDRFLFRKNNAESRETLSRQMGAYWASFARDGAPSALGAPTWPAYVNGEALMRFDSAKDGGPEVINGADTFEALFADLKADERLDDDTRCRVAAGMGQWIPQRRETFLARASCSGSQGAG